MPVFSLSDKPVFPPVSLTDSCGLLAVGGKLTPRWLIRAYCHGIFPWYSRGEPILWWAPDPRLILPPHEIYLSKSLKKTIRRNKFNISMDCAFEEVIEKCAFTRLYHGEETWIDNAMIEAYQELHRLGLAHSVEARCDGELVGGLYGVSLGRCFFGESMFFTETDASKVAFVHLAIYLNHKKFSLIDCQVRTEHLQRFGACEVPRKRFMGLLKKALRRPTLKGAWTNDFNRFKTAGTVSKI